VSDYFDKQQDRMRFPKQVSMDPEMGSEIRARASRRRRTPGAQIVHLLTVGLKHDPEEAVHERRTTHAHSHSQTVTEEKSDSHFRAQPRTAEHGVSRKNRRIA
jgi:hypothetical protein